MHTSRLLSQALFTLLMLLLLAGGGRAQAQDADQLVRRLEEKYNSDQALKAQFTQTVSQGGQTNTLSGTLTLQGDRYRVTTDQQTLVTNGETTWIYTPARGQVLVNDYVEDETAFSPSRFFDGYRERYRVSDVRTTQREGEKHYVLTLKPKQEGAFFREVTLWMRASDAVVTRLAVRDANQSKMTFALRDVSFGVETDASTFRFDAPQDAEVVDLRS